MQTITDRITATPEFQKWLSDHGRSYIGPNSQKADAEEFLQEQPKKIGQKEFRRICKSVMTPVLQAHWTNEVWKRGVSITEFRRMENDLDETGEEETHLLIEALRERGLSDAEMLNLSWGEDSGKDNEMEGRLHHSLSFDLGEAFGVLVRNAPKNMR
jgi:hypothetical protein